MKKLRESRHLIGLTKIKDPDFQVETRPTRPIRDNKSYCGNTDLFFKADLPWERKLSDEEYRRQAAFLRKLCEGTEEGSKSFQNLKNIKEEVEKLKEEKESLMRDITQLQEEKPKRKHFMRILGKR